MLTQIKPTQTNPFHNILKTSDQSMIQPIFLQYKKILSLLVHLLHTPPPVPASPIFTYGR